MTEKLFHFIGEYREKSISITIKPTSSLDQMRKIIAEAITNRRRRKLSMDTGEVRILGIYLFPKDKQPMKKPSRQTITEDFKFITTPQQIVQSENGELYISIKPDEILKISAKRRVKRESAADIDEAPKLSSKDRKIQILSEALAKANFELQELRSFKQKVENPQLPDAEIKLEMKSSKAEEQRTAGLLNETTNSPREAENHIAVLQQENRIEFPKTTEPEKEGLPIEKHKENNQLVEEVKKQILRKKSNVLSKIPTHKTLKYERKKTNCTKTKEVISKQNISKADDEPLPQKKVKTEPPNTGKDFEKSKNKSQINAEKLSNISRGNFSLKTETIGRVTTFSLISTRVQKKI